MIRFENLIQHFEHNIKVAKYEDTNIEAECNYCIEILYEENKEEESKETISFSYPYRDLENIQDDAKGDCPNCSIGMLSIEAKIHNQLFKFEVIICDRCKYLRINKCISESDVEL